MVLSFSSRSLGLLVAPLLALSSAVWAAAPGIWEPAPALADSQVYRVSGDSARNRRVTILHDQRSGEAPANLEAFKKKQEELSFFQKAILGIQAYRIHSVSRDKLGSLDRLIVRGEYVGTSEQKVFFEEWKLYGKNGITQIAYYDEDPSGLPDTREVSQAIDHVARMAELRW